LALFESTVEGLLEVARVVAQEILVDAERLSLWTDFEGGDGLCDGVSTD